MTSSPLKVTLQLEDSASASRPVEAKVVLTNTSKAPVLVNTRMLTNFQTSEGELSFEITGPPGTKHDFQVMVTPRDLNAQDFVLLDPGKSTATTVDLTRYYGLENPGKYEISVSYRNEAEWSKDGHDAWTGEVSSERATLRIR